MPDAELQLAIAACRVSVDGSPIDVPLTGQSWDRFLQTANRHRVQGLCWYGLKPLADQIPATAFDELRARTKEIVAANMRAAAECSRLNLMFQDAGVPLLFIKGLTLGALAYSQPLLKMSMDIDLVIGPENLVTAAWQLRAAGYSPVIPAGADDRKLGDWHARRKESVWRRPGGMFQIDLHTRLADHPDMLSGMGAASAMQMVEVAPGIALPTLAEAELFAYLCVHGASSAWFRLKWITDLAAMLRGKPQEEIERLYRRSQALGAGRSAGQALLLANRIYQVDLGGTLRELLWADAANRRLVRLAERQLREPVEPVERMFGTASIHWSQLGLLPGIGFKLSEAYRQLGDIMTGRGE